MFIKRGDGQVISVVDDKDLSKDQKKAAEQLSEEILKTSEDEKKAKNKK